jgi:hypothetical protein
VVFQITRTSPIYSGSKLPALLLFIQVFEITRIAPIYSGVPNYPHFYLFRCSKLPALLLLIQVLQITRTSIYSGV